MLIPVRCFTCGSMVASKYRHYQKRLRERRYETGQDSTIVLTKDNIDRVKSTPEKQVLDEMNVKRYCCRRHFIAHVDIVKYL